LKIFIIMFVIFLFIGSFVFSGRLSRKIEANWESISNTFPDPKPTQEEVFILVQNSALALGGLSAVILILLFISLASTSTLIGYDYSLKRILKLANYFTGIVGIIILIIASVAAFGKMGGVWMPEVIFTIGVITLLLSIVGYWGTYKQSRLLLRIYFITVCILALTLLIVGILTLVDGESLINLFDRNWDSISKTLPKDTSKAEFLDFMDRNLTLLGCVSISTFIYMVFNEVVAFLLLRQLGTKGGLSPSPSTSSMHASSMHTNSVHNSFGPTDLRKSGGGGMAHF